MTKAPTTYDDLYAEGMTEREALTVAVVLPNLPKGERIIALRPFGGEEPCFGFPGAEWWETDEDTIDEFKRRTTPIVPGSNLYRVTVDHEKKYGDEVAVTPVPHGWRTFAIDPYDFDEYVPVAAEEYEFDDHDQTTLTDFGAPSPLFNPHFANRDAFERDPKLPV